MAKMKLTDPIPENLETMICQLSFGFNPKTGTDGYIWSRFIEFAGTETKDFFHLKYEKSIDTRRQNNDECFERMMYGRRVDKIVEMRPNINSSGNANEVFASIWFRPGKKQEAVALVKEQLPKFFIEWRMHIDRISASINNQEGLFNEFFEKY